MSTFNPAFQSGAGIRANGLVPCEVCMDTGWVEWTGTGGPCEACHDINEDELGFA